MTEPLVGKSDDLISEYWKGKAKEKNTIKTCPAKAIQKILRRRTLDARMQGIRRLVRVDTD